MKNIIKLAYVVLITYLVMVVYWWNFVVSMFKEASIPDVLLFLGMGFVSGVLGFAIIFIINRLLRGKLNSKKWSLIIYSTIVSLLILAGVAKILIDIVTIT